MSKTAFEACASLAIALGVALPSAGCASGAVGTTILRPANAAPGQMGFGTGLNESGGSKMTSFASQAVVTAAGSDPKGPSEHSEGDFFWRVDGGMLQFCEWADDGKEDCRYAVYEGFEAPALLVFLPAIIEPGNLAGGAAGGRVDVRDQNAQVSLLAEHATASVDYVEDKSIWITASTPALIGAQPVFLCSSDGGAPVCRALPFTGERILGSAVLKKGARRVPVLWLHAAANVQPGLMAAMPVDMGIFRCEAAQGHPRCKKAQEVSR